MSRNGTEPSDEDVRWLEDNGFDWNPQTGTWSKLDASPGLEHVVLQAQQRPARPGAGGNRAQRRAAARRKRRR